jgi:hypothetical protein
MPHGKLVVFNDPASPEVEADYNAWYDGDHVPQILQHVPAITAAKRFRIGPGQEMPLAGAPRYLAIYDIEADDVMDSFTQLREATADGRIVMTDTIRSTPPSTLVIYEEI